MVSIPLSWTTYRNCTVKTSNLHVSKTGNAYISKAFTRLQRGRCAGGCDKCVQILRMGKYVTGCVAGKHRVSTLTAASSAKLWPCHGGNTLHYSRTRVQRGLPEAALTAYHVPFLFLCMQLGRFFGEFFREYSLRGRMHPTNEQRLGTAGRKTRIPDRAVWCSNTN